MALGFFDFFGGSKRRSAIQLFDRTLIQCEVNPAYVDDGMRFAIYKWATFVAAESSEAMDHLMTAAAEMISFCVLGPTETETQWGASVRAEREARFTAALARGDDGFDTMLVKLTLAKDIAAPEIRAHVSLETENG